MKIPAMICACMIPALAAAQWNPVSSGTSQHLYDVYFPASTTGYAVGENGLTLRTDDAGLTWTPTYTNNNETFRAVHFTDVQTGYAAGHSLYKTTDGGSTWQSVLTATNGNFASVYFSDANTGFAGTYNEVYRTTDAGATWTSVLHASNTGVFSSICFPSPLTGYFVGGPGLHDDLFRTADGGQTFTKITNGYQSIKEAVEFVNDTVGFMGGWYGGLLVKTTNGGKTWNDVTPQFAPQCRDIRFVDHHNGFILSYEGGASAIHQTTDGGTTWQLQSFTGIQLNRFFIVSSTLGVAVGRNGQIYRLALNTTGIRQRDPCTPAFFPVPAADHLTLPHGFAFDEISLCTPSGQIIRKFSSPSVRIEFNGITAGIYVLRAVSGQDVFISKVVIAE